MAINGIEITDVKIFPVKEPKEGVATLAFAKVIINDSFAISGIRIIRGNHDKTFIKFPQEYNKQQKKGFDICFPTTTGTRAYFEEVIIGHYENYLEMIK